MIHPFGYPWARYCFPPSTPLLKRSVVFPNIIEVGVDSVPIKAIFGAPEEPEISIRIHPLIVVSRPPGVFPEAGLPVAHTLRMAGGFGCCRSSRSIHRFAPVRTSRQSRSQSTRQGMARPFPLRLLSIGLKPLLRFLTSAIERLRIHGVPCNSNSRMRRNQRGLRQSGGLLRADSDLRGAGMKFTSLYAEIVRWTINTFPVRKPDSPCPDPSQPTCNSPAYNWLSGRVPVNPTLRSPPSNPIHPPFPPFAATPLGLRPPT